MKTKILLSSIIILAAMLASCEKFLEEDPNSFLAPSNFPATAEDANLVCAGMETAFDNTMDRTYFILVEVTGDEVNHNEGLRPAGDFYDMDHFTFTPANSFIRSEWIYCYRVINAANMMIESLPDESWAPKFVAEGRFFRAYAYFILTRLWGDVPLLTAPVESLEEADKTTRTPVAEVYNQIIEDLKYAEENLPVSWADNGMDDGRPRRVVAKICLAKVYLTMAGWPLNDNSKWALALQKGKEVLDMASENSYGLVTDYADLFKQNTENGIEHLWSFQYNQDVSGHGTMMSPSNWPRGGGVNPAGWYIWNTTEAFMNTFDDNDVRKPVTFLTEVIQPTDTIPYQEWGDGNIYYARPMVNKYSDWNRENITDNSLRTGVNSNVFRLAEAYLICAEAENEVTGPGNAYQYINPIRERANMAPLAGLSRDEFRTAVRQEWSFELAFEYKRWYNLLRWGIVDQVMSVDEKAEGDYQPYMKLMPIPDLELVVSPGLVQNPGY
jgi:hypothetical protein